MDLDIEKGETDTLLQNIESRLGSLESTVKEILDRGDEINVATMDKLDTIQLQLETQAANMRKLKRKITGKYSSRTLACVIISILVLWSIILRNFITI
jgi:hypothetical protein